MKKKSGNRPSRFKECAVCKVKFKVRASHYDIRKCCSRPCANVRSSQMKSGKNNHMYGLRGENSPFFTGDRLNNYGYQLLYKPEHPNAYPDGYVLEHRYVMSEHLGRPLRKSEVVHHIDGDKLNNRIENLELMNRSSHMKLHSKERKILRDDKNGRIKKILIKE